MAKVTAQKTRVDELAWLLDVTEARQPLSESSPIWIRQSRVASGQPHPERHPYCELNIVLEGEGSSLVGNEEVVRRPGDLLLLGPGIPHWGRINKFPQRSITVYFLPTVFIEQGPVSEGVRILRRFTAKQTLSDRMIRPPKKLQDKLTAIFKEISTEFSQQNFGRKIRLHSLLLELMVLLLRWEESCGFHIGSGVPVDWNAVIKALQFLRDHYDEPVYAQEVARAAGVSESKLKVLFRNALNLSWVKYLQGYRIHRAAALISEGKLNVTEAALEAGFGSISHFNDTFRSFMGAAPRSFMPK